MVLGCDNSVLHRYGLRRFSDQMAGKCGLSDPHAAEKSVAAVSSALQYLGFALLCQIWPSPQRKWLNCLICSTAGLPRHHARKEDFINYVASLFGLLDASNSPEICFSPPCYFESTLLFIASPQKEEERELQEMARKLGKEDKIWKD